MITYVIFTENSQLHRALGFCITVFTVFIYFVFLFTLNSHLHLALESCITTVVTSFTLCFYFNPASAWLLRHKLPPHLQFIIYFVFLLTLNSHLHLVLESYITTVVKSFTYVFTLILPPPSSSVIYYHCIYSYYILGLFINFKFPPPPGSCVIHYHCSYICYFMFLL